MIIVIFNIMASQNNRHEILKTMRSIQGPTLFKPGCLSCCLYEDIDNKNSITLIEKWASQNHLNDHISSEEYRKLLALMEMSIEQPEISFYNVSSVGGPEVLASIIEDSLINR